MNNSFRYSNQVGSFEKDSLSHYVDNLLQGKIQRKKLQDDFDFDDFNCAKVHAERMKKREEKLADEGKLEDEILNEILQEQKEKERLLKEEAAGKSKKGKAMKNEL